MCRDIPLFGGSHDWSDPVEPKVDNIDPSDLSAQFWTETTANLREIPHVSVLVDTVKRCVDCNREKSVQIEVEIDSDGRVQ